MGRNKKLAAALLLAGITGSANAQWAVFDVNSIYANWLQAQMSNGIRGSVNVVNSSLNAMMKQNESLQKDTDERNRAGMGENLIRDKMLPALPPQPDIDQCIEVTASGTKSKAIVSSKRGIGKGPQGVGPGGERVKVTSAPHALGNQLANKKELQTCTPEFAGVAGCGEEKQKYAGGDIHPDGIKGNIANVDPQSGGATHQNLTLDDEGLKVAQKYIADSVYYDAPRVPPKEKLAQNPTYAAYYSALAKKLHAAGSSMRGVMTLAIKMDSLPSGPAGASWAAVNDYAEVTGYVKKPDIPSLKDLLEYSVNKDYIGNPSAPLGSITEVNRRLAISNFISWNRLKQQEDTNILLAHMLVQMTTPVSKAQVDAEYAKTMNAKTAAAKP